MPRPLRRLTIGVILVLWIVGMIAAFLAVAALVNP